MQTRKPIVAGQFYPAQHDACVDEINEYLDELFPNPELRPMTPLSRARMRAWIKEEEDAMFPLVRIVSFELSIKRRAELFGEEIESK